MTTHEEESLIDDMREAIRADRERLAARVAKPAAPTTPPAASPTEPKSRLRRLVGRQPLRVHEERQHYNLTLAALTFAGVAYALLQTMVVPALPEFKDD